MFRPSLFVTAGAFCATAMFASLSLSGCATNEIGLSTTSNLSGSLNGIGSSAQGAAQTVWAAGFQTLHTATLINYDPQGSGAGRKNFLSGAVAFAGSDDPLRAEEVTQVSGTCAPDTPAINLPVYISPIVLAYNIDGVDELILTAETIAGIFSGQITRWSDSRITTINPKTSLPDAPITVVHRSDDSGTTKNFTDFLAKTAPDIWKEKPSQTFPFALGDAAKGTSGVATATLNSSNSIAYIDESGAAGLNIAHLQTVNGNTIRPTAEGAAAAAAAAPLAPDRNEHDVVINIDRNYTEDAAWPLVLVSYMITCQTYSDQATGNLMREYASYILTPFAQNNAAQNTGSAPLDAELASKVLDAVKTIR